MESNSHAIMQIRAKSTSNARMTQAVLIATLQEEQSVETLTT